MTTIYFGVYRVLKSGALRYVPRSCTSNEKLAREIAEGLTRGEITMPDGRIKRVVARPHIAHTIRDDVAESPLTAEEVKALQDWRAQYGREWKQYLMAAWLCYSHRGAHMGGTDTGILRSIRNDRGCDWLRTYKLPD